MSSSDSLSIVYACVTKRSDVQVEAGDKTLFKDSLKAFIEGTVSGPAAKKNKGSFTHGPFSYNFLKEGGHTFVAIAGKEVQTRVLFNFLGDMKKEFDAGSDKVTYKRNLERLILTYKSTGDLDRIEAIHSGLDEVRGVMRDNLDKMVKRGAQLEVMDQTTSELEADAATFKSKSVEVKKVAWWRRIRFWVIVGGILLVVIFVIVIIICGGFSFKNC